MLEVTTFTSACVQVPIAALRSTQYSITSNNAGRDKSFVDDLDMGPGTVRMRVAFVLRSTEVQPAVLRFVGGGDGR